MWRCTVTRGVKEERETRSRTGSADGVGRWRWWNGRMVREAVKKRSIEAMRLKSTTRQGEIGTVEESQLRRRWKHSCRKSKKERWRKTEWRRFCKCPAAWDDSAGLHNHTIGPKGPSGNCAANSEWEHLRQGSAVRNPTWHSRLSLCLSEAKARYAVGYKTEQAWGVCQRISWAIYSRFTRPDNWIKGLIKTSDSLNLFCIVRCWNISFWQTPAELSD